MYFSTYLFISLVLHGFLLVERWKRNSYSIFVKMAFSYIQITQNNTIEMEAFRGRGLL